MLNYFCPNKDCKNNDNPPEDWYIKKGYYRTGHNRQPVPRYQCKCCKTKFSSRTFKDDYRHHKPAFNLEVFNLLCSGVSQRRTAIVLKINRNTVIRKFQWLAFKSRCIHEDFIKAGVLKTSYVQFDEMETYETEKCLPLSIALAVRPKTGQIIEAKVGQFRSHGYLTHKAMEKYDYDQRPDSRATACRKVLKKIKKCEKKDITIVTDGKPHYRTLVQDEISEAKHKVCPRTGTMSRGSKNDMFGVNVACARLRHDIGRLSRRTWDTTKKAFGLQLHLDMFISFQNHYNMKDSPFGKYTGKQFLYGYKLYTKCLRKSFYSDEKKEYNLIAEMKIRKEKLKERKNKDKIEDEIQKAWLAYGWSLKKFK